MIYAIQDLKYYFYEPMVGRPKIRTFSDIKLLFCPLVVIWQEYLVG